MKRAFWIVVSILFMAAGIWKLTSLLALKNAYQKNHVFMEQAEDFDVLFLGTSHVINAVFPMELWQEYGITSYNLAGHAHPLPATYWVMINALDYASPDLVVVDCYGLDREDKSSGEFGHQSFDSIPLSGNKVRAVFDLYETTEERMEYLWNFSIYHNRWDTLGTGDFMPEDGVQKGAELRNVVEEPEITARIGEDESCTLDTTGTDYLRRLIEECQNRDISVLLTFMPFPASGEDQLAARYVRQIAEEYGVRYINFLDMDIVDYEVDCCDAQSHLNASGARKVTEYLGKYIRETYHIADHREEEAYGRWQEDYEAWRSYKVRQTTGLESLQNYLMMLSVCDMDCYIYIEGDSGIWRSDDIYVKLLENLAGETELIKMQAAMQNGGAYLLVVKQDAVTEYAGEEALVWKEAYMAQAEETDSVSDVEIVVMNPADGSTVDRKRFADRMLIDTQ